MRASLAEKIAGYGVWTYRGAWALEVAAAVIGLSTGVALGYQAFSASGSATSMDLVLASAPFFMVALAELTKIPAATLLFLADWRWKPIVLVFMVALAGITFETVFMGLERAATLRQLEYENLRQKIDGQRIQLDNLKVEYETKNSVNQVAEAQAMLSDLIERAKTERATIQDDIDQLDKQLDSAVSLSPEATRARDALAEKKAERDQLRLQQNQRIDAAVRQFEGQRDSFVERIKAYTTAADLESAKKVQVQLDALVNPRPRLEKEALAELQPVLDEVTRLQALFDTELAKSKPMTEDERSSLQKRRVTLVARLDQVTTNWNKQVDDARQRLADAQLANDQREVTNSENLARQTEISQAIADLEGERIPMARGDQIRRIAGRFFGLKPEDVTEDQADLVSVIWFGSLAALAALAGPVTASVALALQRLAPTYDRQFKRTTFLGELRRLVRAWRWHRVKTLKIPVEVKVEVEKEVEKRIEVPVETVVKEILYVPVLTDDPDMVLATMRASLPPEVTDAVQTASKRPRRAGKAQHAAT